MAKKASKVSAINLGLAIEEFRDGSTEMSKLYRKISNHLKRGGTLLKEFQSPWQGEDIGGTLYSFLYHINSSTVLVEDSREIDIGEGTYCPRSYEISVYSNDPSNAREVADDLMKLDPRGRLSILEK